MPAPTMAAPGPAPLTTAPPPSLGLAAPSLQPGRTTVTLAGTGRAGNADGPGPAASFMLPTVLRYAPDGTLYVVDTAGQRIRAIDPQGNVTTVAGGGEPAKDGLSVIGGHVDGPAANARFNDPTGLAIGPDGALYVADTDNYCIRKIAGGLVTTFVGRAGVRGKQNGPAAKVTFTAPMGLTFDKDGNLWVADEGVGIRKVLPNGRTFTLHLTPDYGNAFTDVQIHETPAGRRLYAAMPSGVLDLNYVTRASVSVATTAEGSGVLRPYTLLALSGDEVLTAEPSLNVLRYVRLVRPPVALYAFSRVVAGNQNQRPDLSGGYRDGLPGDAFFASPTGLALAPNGDIAVADAGNRRIRMVPAIDRRRALTEPVPQHFDRAYFNVVYIGNSYAFWNAMWDDSIPGTIESRLNAERAALGIDRPVRVTAARFDGSGVTAKLQYVKESLADAGPDMILWSFNGFDFGAEAAAQSAKHLTLEQTADVLASILRDLAATLAGKKIAFFAGTQPVGIAFAPAESTFPKLISPSWRPFDQNGLYIESLIERAVATSGVPSVLSLSTFEEFERGPRPTPLFEPVEGGFHFTPAGNAFYADILVRALETQKPWLAAAK